MRQGGKKLYLGTNMAGSCAGFVTVPEVVCYAVPHLFQRQADLLSACCTHPHTTGMQCEPGKTLWALVDSMTLMG